MKGKGHTPRQIVEELRSASEKHEELGPRIEDTGYDLVDIACRKEGFPMRDDESVEFVGELAAVDGSMERSDMDNIEHKEPRRNEAGGEHQTEFATDGRDHALAFFTAR